jgi:hypothetical protein
MTDTEPRNATDLPGSENSDWGHPGREHATQEQSATGPSGWAHPADTDPQRRAGSHQGSADPADNLTTDAVDTSGSGDDAGTDAVIDDGGDAPLPGDSVPGDGTVDGHPIPADVEIVATVAKGRETDAARADTSDATPTPRETPAERTG